MPPLPPRIRREDSKTRGRHLVANVPMAKGELVFCERPMILLQSTGNVFSGALTCHYCGAFCGSPLQSLTIATDPMQLPKISTSLEDAGDYSIVPCRDKCGAVYCSVECQQDDFEWGGHQQLCTGLIEEDNHPLVEFKKHAIESNEIFLLIAQWIARIHNQKVPYHDDETENTHPYTDFMMNPWWDVVSIESPFDKSTSKEEMERLVGSCKRLCNESHGFLQQAWSGHKDSEWLTPLGMARLIGSLEQNCVGVRRKHALRMTILQEEEFRRANHEQLLMMLQSGGCDDENCDEDHDGDEEGESNVDEETQATGGDKPQETDTEPSQPTTTGTSEEEEQDGEEEEEADYSVDELADFFSTLPSPFIAGKDDEWDDIFTPMDGTAHYSTLTKMNHSCDPNILVLYKTHGWGKNHPLVAYCVALRDIAPGEELTISYIKTDETYKERQAALSNYGFLCECQKCKDELTPSNAKKNGETKAHQQEEEDLFGSDSESEKQEEDKNGDMDDLFGSDDEDDEDANDEGGDAKGDDDDAENDVDGETKLKNALEHFEEDFNKSTTGSIPLKYLAPASTHVLKICSSVLDETKPNGNGATDETERMRKHLSKCMTAIRDRHFVDCRRVGTELELLLYQQLQAKGSWPAMWYRHTYWCACIAAAIGYSHECSFLMSMRYLDKAMIMGQERNSPVLDGLISYVEHFAYSMAAAPCPPAIDAAVMDCKAQEETLRSKGLSEPIQYPVAKARTKNFEDFVESLGSQSEPVVVRGFAKTWEALTKWRNLQDLARSHGHRLVPIEVGSMDTGMKEELVSFRTFIATYLAPSTRSTCTSLQQATDPSSSIAYLAQHPLLNQIPALYQDVPRQPHGLKPTNVNIWMGTGGTRTPLHFDSYDNVFVQLVGAKYVRLYDKSETPNLYVSKDSKYGLQGNMSAVNCEMEDFEKHPKAKEAQYTEVLLLPGDALFIPARCWHYVRSLSTSISVNYWF